MSTVWHPEGRQGFVALVGQLDLPVRKIAAPRLIQALSTLESDAGKKLEPHAIPGAGNMPGLFLCTRAALLDQQHASVKQQEVKRPEDLDDETVT